MRVLFVHQNFPGQFRHLAPALVARGNEVCAMTMQPDAGAHWNGVKLIPYRVARASTPGIHPWLIDFETKTIRAEAALRAALALKVAGYEPDVIVSHPGWGESLFLKDVWPAARLGIYAEFFYRADGADLAFDPEFSGVDPMAPAQMRLKNINNLLHFDVADAALAPTQWQASTFPAAVRSRISVIHDGVDTQALVPNPGISLSLNGRVTLTRADEVVTFVNRNLEPYRGYHIFMRALPALLRERPHAQVLIVGGDEAGYGQRPPAGATWRQVFLAEVAAQMTQAELERIHFLGNLPYEHFIALLQLSTVHVYLTYPFVLSWSLLEAMSVGCAIVASDTPPVQEVVQHGKTGVLVPFFDVEALAREVTRLLADPQRRRELGVNARQHAAAHYDLRTVCLPGQLDWVERLATPV